MEYVPARSLPREDKERLEVECATMMLNALVSNGEHQAEQVRPNPDDPPDVLFDLPEGVRGVELVELVPENRLAKDHQIRALRDRVLDGLTLGPNTRNRHVTVFLLNDYASRFEFPRTGAQDLVASLSRFFDTGTDEPAEVPTPPSLASVVRRISVTPANLANDPRVRSEDAPLITFGSQNTNFVPDDDFPALLTATLEPKLQHDLHPPTWLLIWSHHPAFGPMRDELIHHIGKWFYTRPCAYERIFYLHRRLQPSVTEFHQKRDGDGGGA